jgi:TPP-dependent pyruvate/acetoin dehydrogenase alpha subunit
MWASAAGEEAAQVLCATLADEHDWIHPGPRDVAVAMARGLDLEEVARQVLAHPSSETHGRALAGRVSSTRLRIAASQETLGLHLALASGRAHAQKLDGHGHVTVALFGEGLTTCGLFHETIALAVTCDLPLVLICKSQVWPDGAPPEAGLLGDSVADRVRSAGLWSRRADGADPFDVHRALYAGFTHAREGRGPALVECVVTQMRFDPPAHRDPIERLRRHLDTRGVWSTTFQDVIEAEIRARIDDAFANVENDA